MFSCISLNESTVNYPPVDISTSTDDKSLIPSTVVNDTTQSTEFETAMPTTFPMASEVVKEEPLEELLIDETSQPLEAICCGTQIVKPEPHLEVDPLTDIKREIKYETQTVKSEPEPCPTPLPELDLPTDAEPVRLVSPTPHASQPTCASGNEAICEQDPFEYHECKPLAFVSVNDLECFRCRKSFPNRQRLQLHLLECRDKDDANKSFTDKHAVPVLSIPDRCPAHCCCSKCRHGSAKPALSAGELQQVIARIASNHRRRSAPTVDFVEPPHFCPCGQTFTSALFLNAHTRLKHKGKVPESSFEPEANQDEASDVTIGHRNEIQTGNEGSSPDESENNVQQGIRDAIEKVATDWNGEVTSSRIEDERQTEVGFLKSRNVDRREDVRKYPCRFCEREFLLLSARNTHTKTVHKGREAINLPNATSFDMLLQSESYDNVKQSKGRAKPKQKKEKGTKKVVKSHAMIQMNSHGNFAKSNTKVTKREAAQAKAPIPSNPCQTLPSTTTNDAQISTKADITFCTSLNNKLSQILNSIVSSTTVDSQTLPLNTNVATLAENPRKPSEKLVKEATGNQQITATLPKTTDYSSDSNDSVPDVTEINRDTDETLSDASNDGANVPSGSSTKPLDVSVKSGSKLKPNRQSVKSANVGKSHAVLNLPGRNPVMPSGNDKNPRSNSAKVKTSIKTALASARGQSAKPTQLGSNLPPSQFESKQSKASAVVTKRTPQLQKVFFIDLEGEIGSLTTKDDNPTEKPLYMCNICDLWFNGNEAMLKHRTDEHIAKPTVKCARCNQLFLTEKLAQEHASFAHVKEISLEQKAASTAHMQTLFVNFWAARERRIKHDKEEAKNTGEKYWGDKSTDWRDKPKARGHFPCLVCNTSFATKTSLRNHKNSEHKKADFICDVCGKLYAIKTALERHLMECTKPKVILPCKTCGKKFASTRHMKAHIKVSHSNVREFECDTCKKRFNQLHNLRFHIKTQHNGERKYHSCLKCKKVFTALNSVRLHDITAHQAVDCNFCDFTVIGKAALREHVLTIHRKPTANKLSCENCLKTFANKNTLESHWISRHSGEDIVPTKKPTPSKDLIFCDVCGKAYLVKASLVRHMSVKHAFVESYFVCDRREVKKGSKRKGGKSSDIDIKEKKKIKEVVDSVASGFVESFDFNVDSVSEQPISEMIVEKDAVVIHEDTESIGDGPISERNEAKTKRKVVEKEGRSEIPNERRRSLRSK